MHAVSLSARRRNERGFTLVELMVVVLILGIIFAIALPVYNNTVRSAKITTLQTDITSTAADLAAYRKQYGSYPSTAAVNNSANKLITQTDPNNTITYYGNLADGTYSTTADDVCVQGTRTFSASDVVTFSYNLGIGDGKILAKPCAQNHVPAVPTETPS